MNSPVLEDIERRHATIELSRQVADVATFTDINYLVRSLHLAWDHIENMRILDEQAREATLKIRDILSSGGS